MAAYVPDISCSSHHRPRRAHSHKPRPLSPRPLPLHLQDPHRSRVRRQDHTSYPTHSHHSYRYERAPCCSPCHSTVSHFNYSPSLSPSPWYHSPRSTSSRNTFDYSNHLHSRSYAHSFDFLDTPPVSAGRRGHQRSFDFLDSPRGTHCRRGQTTSFDFTGVGSSRCPDYSSVRLPSRRVSSHCHERRGTSVIIGGDWYEPRSHDSMSTLSTASSRAAGGVTHQGPNSPLIEYRATPTALRIKQLPTCRKPYYSKSEWVWSVGGAS